MQLSLPSDVEKLVVVAGVQGVIDRDIVLYKKAFNLHNFTILHDRNDFGGVWIINNNSYIMHNELTVIAWKFIFCMVAIEDSVF